MLTSLDKILMFEAGELEADEVVDLFQELLNTGLCWELQGSYGRTARQFIDQGMISLTQGGR